MKMTTLFLFVALLQVAARTTAQVTIKERSASLVKVLVKLKEQSGYGFIYDGALLRTKAKPVTVDVNNVPIERALEEIFRTQDQLSYVINGKVITVKEKNEKKLAQITEGLNPRLESEFAPPTIDVSGRITDEDGNPLMGASVMIKGTKLGTQTNAEGYFILKGVDEKGVLEISYVGFEKIQISVTGMKVLTTFSLKRKEGMLNEVIIRPYWKETQRFSVSPSSRITSKDIERQPESNPLLTLLGRIPGAYIRQETGLANGSFSINIQGINSIANGNNPLIVVDGIPLSFELEGAGNLGGPLSPGSFSGGNNPINFINPSDIESIDILMDADATAIYGSRAANGAILITTKKGKLGKSKVSVSVQQGIGRVTRKIDMMNTRQYLDMRYEAIRNDGLQITSISNYDLRLFDTTRYTDWQKELIGGAAFYTNANASISGGTSEAQYLIGGTYRRQTTVFPGKHASKSGAIHFDLSTSSADKKFKVSLTGSYMLNTNGVPGADLTTAALRLVPNAPPLYDSLGKLNWMPNTSGASTWDNPLASTIYQFYEHEARSLASNAKVSYSILPGLQILTNVGYNNTEVNSFYGQTLEGVAPEDRTNLNNRRGNKNDMRSFSWNIEPQIHWNTQWRKAVINVIVGGTIQKSQSSYSSIIASGFSSDLLLRSFPSATSVAFYYNNSLYRYAAGFGRVSTIWDRKYMLNLTFRRDGSSRFGEANRYANFWSAGGGWIFSEERFVKKSLRFLSFGKLRASYGVTGNDGIGNYRYQTNYSSINNGIAYQNIIGLNSGGVSNPHLQWEEVYKLQGGVDLGFFKNRLELEITAVQNRSSNQLIAYPLPGVTGSQSIAQNLRATVQNTALQLAIRTTNLNTKDFKWTSGFNLTLPNNKVLKFPGIEETSYAAFNSGVIVGQPLGSRYYFQLLGVDPALGRYTIAGPQGSTLIASVTNPELAQTKLLSFLPRYYGGIVNQLTYKRLTLDITFQFTRQLGERSFYFWNGSNIPGLRSGAHGNQPISVLERWQKYGDNTPIGRFSTSNANLSMALLPSSDAYYSYDASFIRLKNLSLNWQLPDPFLRRLKLQNGYVFFRGQNLFTITRYSGLDPETGSNTLPPLQMLTTGFQIIF